MGSVDVGPRASRRIRVFEGLTGLRALLVKRFRRIVHTVTERLLSYALGVFSKPPIGPPSGR